MKHKDQRELIQAKRMREALDDEEASRLQELLEAAQKQEQEKPVYKEGSYEQG